MLDSRVFCDQQLNERMQQRFASLSNVVHKLGSCTSSLRVIPVARKIVVIAM